MQKNISKLTMIAFMIVSVFVSNTAIKAEGVDTPPANWAFDETSRELEQAIINAYPEVDLDSDGYITITEANGFSPGFLPRLVIANKGISGTMNGVQHFIKITALDLHGNNLSGSIPSDIDKLTKVNVLSLYNNQLTGEIPASIGNFNMLGILQLNNNKLEGNVPEELGNLINLRRFDVEHNNLSGDLPSTFGQLTNLENVDLRYNNLTGSLPDISGMTKITALHTAHNNFSGEVPAPYGLNTSLKEIDLHANIGLSGVTENIFVSNTALKYLDVRHTEMTQTKPNLETLKTVNGGFFGYNILNETETNLLDFVTQEILDTELLKVNNISNNIAKADFRVYIEKAQAMYSAREGVNALLVAPEYIALEENITDDLVLDAKNLTELVVEGELKEELRAKLTLVDNMVDALKHVDNLFDENDNFKDELNQEDIDLVLEVVEALHESDTTELLLDRLEKAQVQYDNREDAIAKVDGLFDENDLIVDEVDAHLIEEAQEAVNKLPDGDLKIALQEKIEEAKRQLAERQYVVLKDFVKYTGSEKVEATLSGPARLFDEVSIDGAILDESHYMITEGSTVVNIHDDYLKTLKNGEYDIQFSYTNSEIVNTKLLVDVAPVKSVITGIENNTLIFIGILVVAAGALVVLYTKKKK